MPEYKRLSSCKPPEPWYHEPVRCHKVPEDFVKDAVMLKVMHLTKHKDDSLFTFTVKCDYGPYAYVAIHRNYDINMAKTYATLEANIGLYKYVCTVSASEFDCISPNMEELNFLIANAYIKLLKALGHPLYHSIIKLDWKVEYDEAELRGFRSLCRKEDDNDGN